MLVLALDTATSGCAVALVDAGPGGAGPLAWRAQEMPRGQSEALMPMVNAVMEEAGRKLEEVELFAVTAGPGGFTGLRIGLAAARGMALAAKRPCIGITTFDALAHAVPTQKAGDMPILTIVESKRTDAFLQLYSPAHEKLGEPATLAPEALAAWLDKTDAGKTGLVVIGDAARKFTGHLHDWGKAHDCPVVITGGTGLPDPVVVARLAAAMYLKDGEQAIQAHPARPVYLRAPDVSKPKDRKKRAAS